MKTICAWCGKLILDGPEMTHSHGICNECEEVMTDEFKRARHERDDFIPYHDGKCRGPFDFVGEQVLMGFAVFMIFFLVIMAAEGLYWLTGGKVPELIEWQPKNQPVHTDFKKARPERDSASTFICPD